MIIFLSLYLSAKYLGIRWQEGYLTIAFGSIFLFEIVASCRNFYGSRRTRPAWREAGEDLLLWTLSFTGAAMILTAATGWPVSGADRHLILDWYGLSVVGIAASRTAAGAFLRRGRAFGRPHRSVAFVGATETTERLAALFQAHPRLGIDVVGLYDDRIGDQTRPLAIPRAQLSGTVDDLLRAARAGEVSAVYISLPMEAAKRTKAIIERIAQDTTASIHYCPTFVNFDPVNGRFHQVLGHPVVSVIESPFDGYQRYVKRLQDLVLASLILPLILVPIAIIALAVKLTSPGPVFYRQTRNGLGGRPFKIWKFRTMYTVDSDADFVQATKNDARITPLGRFLRDTSLDELPQFFNVLQGHMSVVGPRPAPVKYNDEHRKLIDRYMVRHKVKPGITGLAQVNGSRGETESIEKTATRTEYDLRYVENWSIWLDLQILFRTIAVVIRQIPAR